MSLNTIIKRVCFVVPLFYKFDYLWDIDPELSYLSTMECRQMNLIASILEESKTMMKDPERAMELTL